MTINATRLDPKVLGFWVKCIRETFNWSQEAVAENAGLDVRTIQRVEAGNAASVTTRRALARGLGYENPDIFDTPDFITSVHKILGEINGTSPESMEKQFPDHMRLPVTRVQSGDALGLADISTGLLLHMEDELSQDAKQTAAALFDYLRDVQDIRHEASFADKLAFNNEMGVMLTELEANGAIAYSALRQTKIVGQNWEDKTPMPFTAVRRLSY
ncbi:helix-turn-helix transcriptional regulator [Rhizobium sp. 007]|uniref:helix-turn-helix transcriptional regulator n=1 Tax=Rhizobium sp. 007 TaxID=2785056 RepID=UPI0018902F8F|nr:helix-turn-helix transcriptional regulator [Rhizobium sp. 007]QPB24499.1 helix-turn-helix transcriptional regulator [Rhizobium sp. 007]